MSSFITEYPQFFTTTNLEWKKLLKPDEYKDIVISSLRFLVNDKRAKVFAFVIFPLLVFSKSITPLLCLVCGLCG